MLQKGHLCGALLDAKSWMERHSRSKTPTEHCGAWEVEREQGLSEVPQGLCTSGGLGRTSL